MKELTTRTPWLAFLPAVAALVAADYVPSNPTWLGTLVQSLGWIYLAGVLWVAVSNGIVVGPTLVTIRSGLLSSRSLVMPHSAVEGVEVVQGPFGSLLGYGAIAVAGAGGTKTRAFLVRNPEAFRSAMMRVVSGDTSALTTEPSGLFDGVVVRFLHATHEEGAAPQARYRTAKRMYNLAIRAEAPNPQRRLLHLALDVVLHEGRYQELQPNSDEQRAYWELGHAIATEIEKHQAVLNIQQFWFASSYAEAVDEMNRR